MMAGCEISDPSLKHVQLAVKAARGYDTLAQTTIRSADGRQGLVRVVVEVRKTLELWTVR
jgi:hypothetical protein